MEENKKKSSLIQIIIIIVLVAILGGLIYFAVNQTNNTSNIMQNGEDKGPGGMSGGGSSQIAEGQIGSWSQGGTDASTVDGNDYDYNSALYIKDGAINSDSSNKDRITNGTYDEKSASNIEISDSESGHNGIIVLDSDYTVSNANINMLTNAAGTDTCDFSGKGTAISAFGKSNVTIDNSKINTKGVATMPIFADDGATLTLKNSVLNSYGGTLYKAYLNTPSQTLMVAPPWVLGIMGTSRGSNMMGTNTTTNVVDSEVSAGAWAVLSTDAGSNMYLNVYNTKMNLLNKDESVNRIQEEGGQISESLDNPYTENYGTGYGTYAIGNAVETFAGTEMNVGTYATIFTGGSATYTSLEKGKTYSLKNSSGETSYEYTANEDKVTTINSDTFGFMAHQSTNKITLEKGTKVDSGYATFLVKSGASNEALTATIDDCEISNGGVLIQVMDNDDSTTGGMMDTNDEANTNGGSQNFKPVHTENAGFNTDSASADSTTQNFTFTNGTYEGNIYNASGSNGLKATTLNVTIGKGAIVKSAVASTSAIHINYDGSKTLKNSGCYAFDNKTDASTFANKYQNTSFTINEYYYIGHVANMINDNGGNQINIKLTDDAVWQVTKSSLIKSLEISGSAKVIVPNGVTLTVNGKTYTNTTLTSENL